MVIQVLKSAKENRLRRHHHDEKKKDNRLSSRSSNSLEYKHNYNSNTHNFKYTILLSELTPDNNNQASNENLIVDKKHLNLQNAIIGDNSNIE